jgi:hypothetical protein
MSNYTIEGGLKLLVLDDDSRVPVYAPLSLDEGSYVRLVESQRLLLVAILEAVEALQSDLGDSVVNTVLSAADLVESYTYLDAGTANQRIATATYASTTADSTVLETFNYAGSIGAYYLTSKTRSVT